MGLGWPLEEGLLRGIRWRAAGWAQELGVVKLRVAGGVVEG